MFNKVVLPKMKFTIPQLINPEIAKDTKDVTRTAVAIPHQIEKRKPLSARKLLNGKISNFDNNKLIAWQNIQIISNIGLIIFWIMSNNSNLVVSLPRTFNIPYFLIYILFCAISIFYVVFSRGGKIQSIINAKNGLDNPKTNSIINIAFSLIILMFQYINTTPVATTWSFVGLLSGRELALSMKSFNGVKKITLIKILRDLSVLIYGLLITLIYVLLIKLM